MAGAERVMTTDASSSPGVTPKSSVPAFRGTFDGGLQKGGRLRRIFDWLRRNLFSSYTNAALTILMVGLLVLAGWPFIRWAIVDATISGAAKSACAGDGACWTFIKMRLPTFFYGRYPTDEIWRVNLVGLLLIAFGYPVVRENIRHRGIWLLLLLTVFPIVAGVLLV